MKILFYYPQHFNRSAAGTNPFFDPMLKACDEAGIKYDLYEEPDGGTDKPHNGKAKSAKCFYWTVTILRKLVSLICRKQDFYAREVHVAQILNLLTFGKWKYDRYITISGSMYHLFANLNPKAPVFDMQHGILYKHHPTFFDPQTFKLRPVFYRPNLHWLFFGEGYKECFVRGEEEHTDGKAHVVGCEMGQDDSSFGNPQSHTILYSLQFTDDWTQDRLFRMKKLIEDSLEPLRGTGMKVLLRHHPRFNNVIPMDDIAERFDFVEYTSESLQELYKKTFLHVTYFSTTAFEFSSQGIPTVFLHCDDLGRLERDFYEEFGYPLYDGLSITNVLERLKDEDNYREDSEKVKEWYRKFYSDFDKEKFLEILKNVKLTPKNI